MIGHLADMLGVMPGASVIAMTGQHLVFWGLQAEGTDT